MCASLARSKLVYTVIVTLTIATGIGLRKSAFTDIGLFSDDYMQHAMLQGVYPAERSPFDLFNFAAGSPKERELLMNYGTIPWWNHPKFRLAMMRPLSSAMVLFDYRAFGNNQVAFHIHSMVWWSFFIICVALLLWEVLPPSVAMVTIVLFGIEQAHGLPAIWLANRNALICLCFGTLGLIFHIRWRRVNRKRPLLFSTILFSIALMAGEWTFPLLTYVFTFELFNQNHSLNNRMLALVPTIFLSFIFLAAQYLLDYSTLNSNVYVNPVSDPVAFTLQAAQKIPVFFANLVYGIPAIWFQEGTPWRSYILSLELFTPEVWRQLPGWEFWHVLIGITAGCIGFFIIRWSLRRQTKTLVQELRWLISGSLLSLVPMVASFPTTRLVLPASIGFSTICAATLLATYRQLSHSIKNKRITSQSVVAVFILSGILYTQVWQSSKYILFEVNSLAFFFESERQWILQAEIDWEKVADQDIFLINSIEHTSAFFSPFVLNYHGYPMPHSWRILSAAHRAHDIRRPSKNILDFTVLGGSLLQSSMEKFYRTDKYPYKVGDQVILDEFKVEITNLFKGKPLRFRFIFNKPLEDPSYLFLYSSKRGIKVFDLPRIGEKVRVRRATFPNLLLLSPHKN